MTNPDGTSPRSTSRIAKTGSTPTGPNGAPRPTGSHPTGSVRPSTQRVEKTPTTGQTSKIVKQTASTSVPKTQTQSVARTTGAVKPITQKIATTSQKTGTQRVAPATSSIKKTTGRANAPATRRGGVKANAPTFSLPATKKGRLIMGVVVAGIVVVIVTILAWNSQQIDPKAVKARFEAELLEIKKLEEDVAGMTPERIYEVHRRIQALTEDPQSQYAVAFSSQAKKLLGAAQQRAELQKKADRDVKPFLTEYNKLKQTPEDLAAAAQELNDKAGGLIDQYALTLYGNQLSEIHSDLQKILSDLSKDKWEVKWVGVRGEARKMAETWDCAGAMKKLAEFGAKYKEKEKDLLQTELNKEREAIKRQSDKVPKSVREAYQKLVGEGKKDDAKKELERAKAGLEGFPDPLKIVEQLLKDAN